MVSASRNVRVGQKGGTHLPFSVIVNTCDRVHPLRNLLRSLNHQTYPNFEVVVVVGPTKDDTINMLSEEFGNQVNVVCCSKFNLSSSRNVGLANAAGDVVAFIDDDAVPCPTWLAQLAGAYSDSAVAGAGGSTYNVNPEVGELQFLRGLFSVLAEQDDVRTTDRLPEKPTAPLDHWFPRFHGTNMSYRKEILIDMGGFDERYEYLFDDSDLAARLARRGHQLRQLPEAVVYHSPKSGSNRGEHRYDLNWYCWLRSTIYFAIKNGTPTIGLRKSLTGAIKSVSSFYAHVGDLHGKGEIPEQLYKRIRKDLRKGWVEGFFQGLVLPRKFPDGLLANERRFSPFLREDAMRYRAENATQTTVGDEMGKMINEPLRVCLLSVGYPPGDTHGVSRSTHALAKGLKELGHEVHVVTAGNRSRVISDEGVYVHEVCGADHNRYSTFDAMGYQNLRHWLRHSHAVFDKVRALQLNHEIQIVDSPLWNLDGLVTAVSQDIPVVVRAVTAMKQIAAIHGREDDEISVIAELEGEFLRMASAIISNSRGTVRTLREIYEIDPESTLHHLAPYGIIPVRDEEVPAHEARPTEEPTVLFVGRLEGRKGILDLFEAIPQILRQEPKTRFQIAGSDNSREDGFQATHGMDYPSYFNKKFSSCTGQTEFLGFVDEKQLQRLYRDCDVFVAPSHYESFGLIYLEAMNYARPVIGCRSGGPKDIIVDGTTGFLTPPQDVPALTDAIIRLVMSPERRSEMGRSGRQRLIERFSHIAMAREFVEVYEKLLGGTKRDPSGSADPS